MNFLELPFVHLEYWGDFERGRLPDGRLFGEYVHDGDFDGKWEFCDSPEECWVKWRSFLDKILPHKGKIYWRERPTLHVSIDPDTGKEMFSIYARFLVEATG